MEKEITNKDLAEMINGVTLRLNTIESKMATKKELFDLISESKEETNELIAKSIESLAISTAKGFDCIQSQMATKQDIMSLHLQVNGIEVDLRSFKKEMREELA